jgi:hypothetical protein
MAWRLFPSGAKKSASAEPGVGWASKADAVAARRTKLPAAERIICSTTDVEYELLDRPKEQAPSWVAAQNAASPSV